MSKSYYTQKNSQKEKQPNWSRLAQRSIYIVQQDLLSLLIAPRPSQPAHIDIATVTFPRTCYNILFFRPEMVGGGGRPQIIRFLGHSSVTLSRLNKLCWAPWLVCIYFFLFSFAAIYTHTDVYTHCHLLLGCVSPDPLVCVCVCRRRCVVHCNLGKRKKKKIFQKRRKRTRVTLHTHLCHL